MRLRTRRLVVVAHRARRSLGYQGVSRRKPRASSLTTGGPGELAGGAVRVAGREVPVDVENPCCPAALTVEHAGHLLDHPAARRSDRERVVLDREAERELAAIAVDPLAAAGGDALPAEALDAGDLAVPVGGLEAERAAPLQGPRVGGGGRERRHGECGCGQDRGDRGKVSALLPAPHAFCLLSPAPMA